MFKRKTITSTFLLLVITLSAVGGIVGMASGAGGTYYVGNASEMGTNSAVTYSTIQEAVNAAGENATIKIQGGTYSESVDVNTNGLTFEDYDTTDTTSVTVNATSEKYGDAFFGEFDANKTLGANVQVTENVVYVGTTGTASADTYSTIQNATDAAGNNTTVMIAPGEYKESINVTSEFVGYQNYDPASGDVTINATNTTEGAAFYGEYSDNVRVGYDLTIEGATFAGGSGSIGETLTGTYMGIPIWAFAIVALGLAAYTQME